MWKGQQAPLRPDLKHIWVTKNADEQLVKFSEVTNYIACLAPTEIR